MPTNGGMCQTQLKLFDNIVHSETIEDAEMAIHELYNSATPKQQQYDLSQSLFNEYSSLHRWCDAYEQIK